MSETYLQSLSKTHADWLSTRQMLIAGNIANANTPGFKASDVKPFEEKQALFSDLARTNTRHLTSGVANAGGIATGKDNSWEIFHSGGNVSLANETMKAGQVRSSFDLNTTISKKFHAMLITAFGS